MSPQSEKHAKTRNNNQSTQFPKRIRFLCLPKNLQMFDDDYWDQYPPHLRKQIQEASNYEFLDDLPPPQDYDFVPTVPQFGGFVSAAAHQEFVKANKYLLAPLQQYSTTELPKVEPYYSQCLKEYETMKEQMRLENNNKPNPKKKPTRFKKTKSNTRKKITKKQASHTSPCVFLKPAPMAKPRSNVLPFKPPMPHASISCNSCSDPPPSLVYPSPPPNYPKPVSSIGKNIGNFTITDAPEPKLCEHCKLLPCIVDAHMDELCDRNAESQVLLCDPPDITYRKLSAFFRRLIVKYFGPEYMKTLGDIPICAQDQCHTMAARDDSEFDGFY